ncbi:hypothetical protein [Cysteiniphilum marinum]|uniref:hypothetical protein n=1 Tax=Cysteiniphilum marinum TaxID=2774191 RepID=UPI00193AFE6A|nr:hypothetical protein [Cysteiniphilum marinum]
MFESSKSEFYRAKGEGFRVKSEFCRAKGEGFRVKSEFCRVKGEKFRFWKIHHLRLNFN